MPVAVRLPRQRRFPLITLLCICICICIFVHAVVRMVGGAFPTPPPLTLSPTKESER